LKSRRRSMRFGNGEEGEEEEDPRERVVRWLEESSRLESLGRESSRKSICVEKDKIIRSRRDQTKKGNVELTSFQPIKVSFRERCVRFLRAGRCVGLEREENRLELKGVKKRSDQSARGEGRGEGKKTRERLT